MTPGPARRLAETLDRRGLGEPARLLADAHRPLAPLLGDLSAAFGPLATLMAGRSLDDARAILEDPDGLEDLTGELSGRHAEPR